MSIKSAKFASLLGNPLNTHNFVVVIPSLDSIQMLVSSTSFPSEQLQEYIMYFQGERVKFPSIPTNSGEWSCTMPEGEMAKIKTAIKDLMDANYNQSTGQMTHWSLTDRFDIEVWARGLRGDVEGSDKVFGVILHGCYLKGRQDVGLDFSQPTSSWNWTLNFSYDWLEDLAPTPLQ